MPCRFDLFCCFASADIPKCVWGDEVQGEEKHAEDDEEEKDWSPEDIALMDLSQSEKQRVVAIKTSMSDARPEAGGELCYVPEDVEDIARLVHTDVDSESLAMGRTPAHLADMAFRMGVYCAFKPPTIVARFVQAAIWRAAAHEAAANQEVALTQTELISHVKDLGQAENPPLAIEMSQTELSQLWTLYDFIQINDLRSWLLCIAKSWTVVRRWKSDLLERALGWLEAEEPDQYYRLTGVENEDEEGGGAEVDAEQSSGEEEQKDAANSRKRRREENPSQPSQSSSGSQSSPDSSSSSNDECGSFQDAASNLLRASQSLF